MINNNIATFIVSHTPLRNRRARSGIDYVLRARGILHQRSSSSLETRMERISRASRPCTCTCTAGKSEVQRRQLDLQEAPEESDFIVLRIRRRFIAHRDLRVMMNNPHR